MKFFIRMVFFFPLLFIQFFIVPPQATALQADIGVLNQCFDTSWPHENSKLTPDPDLVFGRLDNGFRYVVLQNKEPENRVAIYLTIQAGSLHENEEQRGAAHFLEHMLFNGSTHFPPGTLVDYFLSRGMSFGGDTNAHTSYDETVYKIFLPDSNEEELEKGLLVMADYARGALLLESEIIRERGVILAEKRERDSASYRTHEASIKFSMEGTKIPERMPIGILETLNKADHTILKAFYDAWYRPENMVLVMVGDFDPQLGVELIESRFNSLVNKSARPDCPDMGRLSHSDTHFFYHHEPELGATEVSIESLWNEDRQNDSLALQIENVREYLGMLMLRHRLDKLLEQDGAPFTKVQAYSGHFLDRVAYASISATSDPDKWQQALNGIDLALRQALDFGFSEKEFARVKNEMLTSLDKAVLTRESQKSRGLAMFIIKSVNRDRVMQSPDQEQKLYGPIINKMTLAEVERVFKKLWNHNNQLISVTGKSEIGAKDPQKVIRDAYQKSQSQEVARPEKEKQLIFPYLNPQSQQTGPVLRKTLSTVDGKRLVFNNGVIVNLKKTDFEHNEIQLLVDFGRGKQTEPRPGLSMLAQNVINGSGTGRMTNSELDSVLAGSTVKLRFAVGQSSFSWKGKSLVKDQELLFQTIHTLFSDPGLRKSAYDLAMQGYAMMFKQLENDVSGLMQLKGIRFLAGGEKTFGLPSWEEFSSLTIDDISSWLLPAVRSGSLEVSIVGDFDEEEIEKLLLKYLASLLPRETNQASFLEEIHFPAGEQLELQAQSDIEKGLLVMAWPTADFWDIMRTRRLHLLADVFSERLRIRVREKLGASYSPQVFNNSSRVHPGYGVMEARLIVDPVTIEALEKEVRQVARELWQDGISEEELQLTKRPMLTSLKDMVKTNRYWLNSVLSLSSRHPQQLEWPLSILDGFSSVTVEELNELAKRYLKPEKAAKVVIRSQSQAGS